MGQTVGKRAEIIPKMQTMNSRFGTLHKGYYLERYSLSLFSLSILSLLLSLIHKYLDS